MKNPSFGMQMVYMGGWACHVTLVSSNAGYQNSGCRWKTLLVLLQDAETILVGVYFWAFPREARFASLCVRIR
jgi:hypothetical protein